MRPVSSMYRDNVPAGSGPVTMAGRRDLEDGCGGFRSRVVAAAMGKFLTYFQESEPYFLCGSGQWAVSGNGPRSGPGAGEKGAAHGNASPQMWSLEAASL